MLLPGESQGWGARWAAVYGVTQSRTRLSDWTELNWMLKTHESMKERRGCLKNRTMLDVPCWPPRIHPYLPHCVLCPMLTCVSGSLAPSHPHLALVLPREKTAVDEEDGAPAIGVATGCTTLGDVFTHCPPLRTTRTLTDTGASARGVGLWCQE